MRPCNFGFVLQRRVPSSNLCKRIACAAPAYGILRQNATLNNIVNIAQRRVLRAFGKHGPFGGGELTFKPIEQPTDDGTWRDDAKRLAAIRKLRTQGIGILKIARQLGIGVSVVQRVVNL